MFSATITIILILCVLLVIVVLIQNPKGGGISGEFGSSGATKMFGVQKTGDILEQLSWGFAIGIIVLIMASGFFIGTGSSGAESVNVDKAATKPSTQQAAPVQAPGGGTPTTATPAPAK